MEEAFLPQIKDGFRKRLQKLDEFEQELVRVSRDYHGALKQAVVIGLKGQKFDLSRLRSALKQMERRHPAARSVLVDWKTLAEVETDENIIPVLEVDRESEDIWKMLWKNEQSIPVQLNEPLIKVFVLQGEYQSEILITAFPFASDGISLLELTHEIFLTMEDLTRKWTEKDWIKSQYKLTETLFPQICARGCGLFRAFSEMIWTRLCYRIDHIEPESKPQPTSKATYSSGSLLCQGKINRTDFSHLCKISMHVYNVALHPTICVAAMRAVAESVNSQKPSHITAGSTIDMRPIYNRASNQLDIEASDMRHLSSSVSVRSYLGGEVVKSPEHLWREVIKIQQQFEFKNSASLLVHPLITGRIFRNVPNGGYGDSLLVSNLGKPCLQSSYGSVGDIDFVYPLLNCNVLTNPYVCYTTFNGELNYSVIGSPRWLQQEQIDSICKSIKRILNELIEHGQDQLI